MSQFEGKIVSILGKFDISTDLRMILSNFVATDVNALFRSLKKIATYMFKTRGGVQRPFEQC